MTPLSTQVALVTGANKGIGLDGGPLMKASAVMDDVRWKRLLQ
jgi:hypothetical protein